MLKPIEIPLKRKYRHSVKGRFAGGEHPAPKKNKRLGRGNDGYNPREHVLVIQDGKRKWFHFADAKAWLA